MSGQDRERPAARQLPDPCSRIIASRDDACSGRVDVHAEDPATVMSVQRGNLSSGCGIPDSRGAILAGRHQHPSVGAVAPVAYGASVTDQRELLLVENPDRAGQKIT